MKIGLVLSNSPAYSETFFYSKIKGLQAQGIAVVLFTQNTSATFNLCPVVKAPKVHANPLIQLLSMVCVYVSLLSKFKTVKRYIILERNANTTWAQLLKKTYLNAHLLKAKLDWVHFGFATQAIGSELVAKAIGAKMAVSFRGFDIAIYPIKYPECYQLLWEYLNKVHVISDDILGKARLQGLPEQVPVQKITPAIDIDIFKRKDTNSKFNASLQLLTVGRLHWKKGYVATIEALSELKAKGIDFSYTIVGEGIDFERIAFAAYELGLKDKVHFVGKKNREEIVELYNKTDVYLQYSKQEGFCNSVLEAQAMGLLCIVSDAEGLSENIADTKTGWVVPKNNPQALSEKIETVWQLPEPEKNRIKQNAITRVKEQFTIKQQQQKFVEFYENNIITKNTN